MKSFGVFAAAVLSTLWAAPAAAEVYGGFSVGAALMQVEDGEGHGAARVTGKIGGRGEDVGGYASATGAASESDGVMASFSSLSGGVEVFFPDGGSTFYAQFGVARLSAESGSLDLDIGSGPVLGAGARIKIAPPLQLGLFIDYAAMSPSDEIEELAPSATFGVTLLGAELGFQW